MPLEVEHAADPYATSVQWSRRFAGLTVLLSLATIGRERYAAQRERDVALGRRLAKGLQAQGWRVVNRSPLPVACVAEEGADARWHVNTAERIVSGGSAWVNAVELAGRPAIRACITSYRTSASDVDALVEAFSTASATQ